MEQNNDKSIILTVVSNEIQKLKKQIYSLETNTIIEGLDLSDEDILAIKVLKDVSKIRKRIGINREISESEIKDVQLYCINASECAKKLGVSYNCYRKWAKKYGIFKTKKWGRGDKKKHWREDSGKYPLNQILQGKFPNYPIYRLKDILMRSGTKPAECENCGFNEHRITDNKIPLLISFKDGNEKNHILENIEMLCYNCMFLIGRGYISKGNVGFNFLE